MLSRHAIGAAQPCLVLVAAAGAEVTGLVQADTHLLEAVAGAAALHDDHVGRQPGVGGHEVLHQLGRAHGRTWVGEVDEARRDLDLLIEPAGEIEVAVDAEPGAGAVLAVLVEHQPLARHDVEHALGHGTGHEAAVGTVAVLRPAALVLRPQPVQDEGVRPAARPALRIVALLADVGAVGGAPGQRQQVVVEDAGLVLPPLAPAAVLVALVGVGPLAVTRPLGQDIADGQAA